LWDDALNARTQGEIGGVTPIANGCVECVRMDDR
jgi:hypothetical protein